MATLIFFVGTGNDQFGAAQFPVKSDLPFSDRQELDRLLNITEDFRTASESAWLVSRSVYIYNDVVARDVDENILEARGQTLPTGYEGFAKGAIFRVVDAANNIRALYENTGTTTAAIWKVIGLQSRTITVASASFATIDTTPIELIPDPGAGFVVVPISVTGYRVFASESWATKPADEYEIRFGDADGVSPFASISRGFFDGSDTSTTASPSYVSYFANDHIASPSEALVLTASTSATIDGDSYFVFDIIWRILGL